MPKEICRLTPELSDHGQRQDGLEFTPDVHRCPWFAPVIWFDTSMRDRHSLAAIAFNLSVTPCFGRDERLKFVTHDALVHVIFSLLVNIIVLGERKIVRPSYGGPIVRHFL